ncbi:MAG: histidine kinase, partial [bacterium]|nr:histidine kinase [bacterium]
MLSDSDPIRRDIEAVSHISAVPTILRVVSEVSGLRFSVIARVTQNQWVACAVHDEIAFGVEPGGTLDVATTLCSHVRDSHVPLVIDHASADPVYCNHPTPKMYLFESYVAVPIFLADGSYFGNVCALDPLPRQVNQPKILSMMKLFAELISLQLEIEARQDATRAQLSDVQQTSELREQFIAVLGHDLRNPLSSVSMGTELLLRETLTDDQRKTVERIRASGRRMTELVRHLLDFARARLGGGIGLSLAAVTDLQESVRHVIAELESVNPDREIRFSAE